MLADQPALFWTMYLDSLPADSELRRRRYIVEPFGDSPALADDLGALILQGVKTATCTSLWELQVHNEPIPEVGLLTLVVGGKGEPLCVIETTEAALRSYKEVDAAFAFDEGEDDRALESWRVAHWRYFTRTLAAIGREPTWDMPLICERLRVIYRQ